MLTIGDLIIIYMLVVVLPCICIGGMIGDYIEARKKQNKSEKESKRNG